MSKNTKTKDRKPITENQITWFLFALVIIAVYFFALDIPLLGPDEPRYSQVAREMFQKNDWITPTLGGFHWFEKPALLYWLQIISYKIFGVTEFAARFGSAIFGLGTIFALWLFGRFASFVGSPSTDGFANGVGQRTNDEFANYLALIAASSIGLLAFSRGASFDIILTLPITASLVAFFIFDQTAKEKPVTNYISLFAFYFFIGIALIAKGLVGIVFPFAIVAFYYFLSRRFPSKTFFISLFWGTMLSILVACAWYLPMYQANGWKFIDEFFIQHHFQRYTSNKYQHPQPLWFFWVVLPLMTIPWLPFFIGAVWKNVRNFKSAIRNPQIAFVFAWMLIPLCFFSLSGSKLPGYILPALPAAQILTANQVYEFIENSTRREFFIKFTAFATFTIAAIALQFFVMDYARHETTKYLIESANAQGYGTQKIVNLYAVQHNLEFYAAERLVRDTDGKLKRYDDFSELVKDLKSEKNGEILLVVANHAAKNVTESGLVEAKILDDNGEISLIYVKSKP